MTLSNLLKGIRNLLICAFFIGLIVVMYIYRENIIDFMMNLTNSRPKVVVKGANDYKFPWDYEYVQNTNDFEPDNFQELLNIFYTVVNSGWDSFTFYCSETYTNCTTDAEKIVNDKFILSMINNYVHPFNSYRTLQATISGTDRIDIVVYHLYNYAQQSTLRKIVNEVTDKLIKDHMTENDKIRIIHDFIINNAKYDQNMIGEGNVSSKYHSNIAYGPLVEGYAICGGYSDAMQLFLFKMGIKNYKISSEKHIWNFVYTNDRWLHLDLTWDDPITLDGSNKLKHNYFLIDSKALSKLNKDDSHTFNPEFFKEAK